MISGAVTRGTFYPQSVFVQHLKLEGGWKKEFRGTSVFLQDRPYEDSTHGVVLLWIGQLFQSSALARKIGITATDDRTLVIHAYRKWGRDFAAHIDGEYAFILWDLRSAGVLLGRDPLGSHNLYYTHSGQDLYFCSRIQPLLALTPTGSCLNETRIARGLALDPEFTSESFFKDVYCITPGKTLFYEQGHLAESSFWKPQEIPMLRLRNSQEYQEGMREVLDQVVADRIKGHEVIASQLSGGLDSSSVTVTAARQLAREGRNVLAFTAVPQGDIPVGGNYFGNEWPHAAAVAAMYSNINHRPVQHGRHRYFSLIDQYSAATEKPPFNLMNLDWFHEIQLQARRLGARIIFTGGPGNLTLSYDGSMALQILIRQGRLSEAARMAKDMQHQGGYGWKSLAQQLVRPILPSQIRRILSRRGRPLHYPGNASLLRDSLAKKLGLGETTLEDAHLRLDSRSRRLLFLGRADSGPLTAAAQLLTGASISRPLGDRRMIAYCLSIPEEFYCERGVPRSLIRNAMAGDLPDTVLSERRRGMQAADCGSLFRQEWAEALAELSRLKRSDLAQRLFNISRLEEMMQWPDSRIQAVGHFTYWVNLMRAFSTMRFVRRFEDGSLFVLPEKEMGSTGEAPLSANHA